MNILSVQKATKNSVAVNLQIISMGIYKKKCMQMFATGSSGGCRVWLQKEGPVILLLHTLGVYQSVAEVAAQCCDSDLQGVGLLHQWRWQLVHHPALFHHLHWCKRASQDGAGLLDKFIKSPPVCCQDAAAPADYSIENGWCHHRVIERCQECPLHPKGPELPQ